MDPSGETNDDRKKKRALDLHSTLLKQDCSSSSPSSTFLRKRKKLCLVGSNQSSGNNSKNSDRHQCQLDYSSFWCNLLYSTLFPQAVLPVVAQSSAEDQAVQSSTSRNREKIRNQRSVKDNRTNMVEYDRAMSNMTTTAQHCTTATLSSAQMALSALVNPQQQDYPQSGTGSIGASTTKDMNISIGGDDKPQDQELIDDGRSGGRNKPNKQIHLDALANEQQPLSPSSGHISILSSNYTEKNKATTAAAAAAPLILPLGRTFGGISLFIR